MKHIKADRCGYQGYSCKGLGQLAPIFAAQICSDTTNYDNSNSLRSNHLNFFNIATTFQGPILSTQFLDLSSWNLTEQEKCKTTLQPFGQGLVNAWKQVKDQVKHVSGDVASGSAQGSATISDYSTEGGLKGFQPVGVLTPNPRLTQFVTPQAIAVPIVRPGKGGGSTQAVKVVTPNSGAACPGFEASASVIVSGGQVTGMRCTVQGGKVIYMGKNYSVSSYFKSSTSAQVLSVYIMGKSLGYQLYQQSVQDTTKFQFWSLDSDGGQSPAYPVMLVASFKLVCVTQDKDKRPAESCYVQVTQAQCGPILWPVLQPPSQSDQYALISSYGRMKWVKVYNC